MPILSDRKLFLRELEDVLRTLAQFDEDGSSDFEEILDIKARLEETRYFNLREHHEKNHCSLSDMNFFFFEKKNSCFFNIETPQMKQTCFVSTFSMLITSVFYSKILVLLTL